MIHKNPPHQLCGDAVKLRPILPAGVALVDQFQISLINQGGGLQRVALSFPAQIVPGESPQLAVNQGHQLIERLLVALPPIY